MKTALDIQKLFEEKTIEIIGIIVTAIFLSLNRFFKRLPDYIFQKIRKEKQLEGLQKGSAINNVIRELALNAGAIYVHLIRYHNGGPYKMTVEWESLGRACPQCITKCKNYKGIPPLQNDWRSYQLSNIWAEIVAKTIQMDGVINEVDGSGFDQLHKDMWNNYKIHSYKEVIVKHKSNKDTWCLGLSFCQRFEDHHEANAMMDMARRKLKDLL